MQAAEALGYKLVEEKVRRQWFIDPVNHTENTYIAHKKTDRHCYIPVTELHPNEVIVDREKLAEAWHCLPWGMHTFESLCKALGLEEEG